MAEFTTEQLERFISAVERLERAVVGAPKEGNVGLLDRVAHLEKRQWMVVVAVFLGSGIGQVINALWI